jgi:hypothetical protein
VNKDFIHDPKPVRKFPKLSGKHEDINPLDSHQDHPLRKSTRNYTPRRINTNKDK